MALDDGRVVSNFVAQVAGGVEGVLRVWGVSGFEGVQGVKGGLKDVKGSGFVAQVPGLSC
jgi:hypothetical protein